MAATWTTLATTPGAVGSGALAFDATSGKLYALRGDASKSFYAYTPTANTWTTLATTPAAISNGGALAFDATSGKLYALRGDASKSFYAYTPTANTWTTLATTPGAVATGGALAFDATSGKLYALRGDASKSFYAYTPTANTWTTLASTPAPVDSGGALAFDSTSGKLYALGGYSTKSFYAYTPTANTWTTLASTPAVVGTGGALAFDSTTGKLYALRGDTTTAFYAYTPTANTWATLATTPAAVAAGGALAFDATTSKLYALRGDTTEAFWAYGTTTETATLATGFEFTSTETATLATGFEFTSTETATLATGFEFTSTETATLATGFEFTSTETWTTLATTPAAVSTGGALAFDATTGKLYALRGDTSKSFYAYTPTANTWTTLATTPAVVATGGALAFDSTSGKLYALGGYSTKSFYAYTPTANTWATLASTPAAVSTGGALAFDSTTGKLYALRGASTAFWAYTPTANTWATLATTPAAVASGGALAFDSTTGKLYALRGDTTAFWAYTPTAATWATLATTPAAVGVGGALAFDSTSGKLYALRGDTTAFWAYTPTAATWATLASTPAAVASGGALAFDSTTGKLYALRGDTTEAFWAYGTTFILAGTASASAAAVAKGTGRLSIPATAHAAVEAQASASVALSVLYATRTRTKTRTTTSSLLNPSPLTAPTPTHVALYATPAETKWWEFGVGTQTSGVGSDSQPEPSGHGAVWESPALWGTRTAGSIWRISVTLCAIERFTGEALPTSSGILHVRVGRRNGTEYTQLGDDLTIDVSLSATPTEHTLLGFITAATIGHGTRLYIDVTYFGTIAGTTPVVKLAVGGTSLAVAALNALLLFTDVGRSAAAAAAQASATGVLIQDASAAASADADAVTAGTVLFAAAAHASVLATTHADGTQSQNLQSPWPIVQISMTDPFQTPSWVTIGAFCRTGNVRGGRQHELDRVEASTATLTFNDRDGRFRPWNTVGPYYNQLSYADSLPNWPLGAQLALGSCPGSLGSWAGATFALTAFPATHQGMQVTTSSTKTATSTKYPVTAGDTYRLRIQGISTAGVATVTLTVKWYNAGGDLLSTSTTTTTLHAGAPDRALSITDTAPLSATECELTWTVATPGTATVVAFRAGMYRVPASFDPGTLWGPGASGFSVRRPVRVLASWQTETYPVFYGYLTKLSPKWPTELNADMQMTATDGLKLLSLAYLSNTQLFVNTLYRDGAKAIWRCGDLPGSYFCQNALVTLANGLTVPRVNAMASATPTASALPGLIVDGTVTFGYSQPIVWDPTTGVRLTATSTKTTAPQPALLGGPTFAAIVATTAGAQPTGALRGTAALTTYVRRTETSTFMMMFRSTSAQPQVLCTWLLRSGASFRIGLLGSGQLGAGPSTPTLPARTFEPALTPTRPNPKTTFATVASAKGVDDGTWHVLHVEFPRTSGLAGTAYVFLDGTKIGTVEDLGAMTAFYPLPRIGGCSAPPKHGPLAAPSAGYSFLGEVANVALSAEILTATTITAQARLARQLSYTELLPGPLIAAMLQVAGWPSTLMSIATGNTVCQPLATAIASSSFQETTYATTGSPLALTSVLDVIAMAQQTEDGLFYQSPTGTLLFIDRHYFQSHRTPAVRFSDTGTTEDAILYEPGTLITQDDLDFWNACQVQRDNGVLQQWQDAASLGRNGWSMYEGLTDLLMASTSDALGLAQWIVERYKDPIARVSTLKLSSSTQQGAAIPWMLGLQLWTPASVQRARAVGISTEFLQTSVVEGYSHSWSPTHWDTGFNMSPFELVVDTWFVLDTPTRGVLNTNRLQY